MTAHLAGLDPVELLFQISSGKSPAAAPRSRGGVCTKLGMQSFAGMCLTRGTVSARRVQLIEREVVA